MMSVQRGIDVVLIIRHRKVLLLGSGFVTQPTAVELDKAGVLVTVGQ